MIKRWQVCAAVLLAAVQMVRAQGLLGGNLIVNGNAEAGPASSSITNLVASIPGWTSASAIKVNVLSYGITNLVLQTDPAPPDHGFQYFAAGPNGATAGTITQDIDVSAAASTINTGTVKFTLSGYLGSAKGTGLAPPAKVTADFKNASGQTFSTATLGPLGVSANGMSLQTQIGLVPSGTVRITVSLIMTTYCENAAACASAAADSLSLVLTPLATSPGMVLGSNLIANPGAEAGAGVRAPSAAPYIPGWSTANEASVAPYGGAGWIMTTDPGPPIRGVNLFSGGLQGANMYQDLDVSAAATLIDASQVTYDVSAWLGSLAGLISPTLTYTFFDWSGKQLAPTAQLGPVSRIGTALMEEASSGQTLPVGTRRIHIIVTFPSVNTFADNIAFVLAGPGGPPVITPAGVLSAGAFGGFASIAPGSWMEIYGTNLANSTLSWADSDFVNGVGPTSLGGVTVSIGGKAAFIDYVSPGQINALVPSDVPTGAANVTVTNAGQVSDSFGLIVNPTEAGVLAPASFQVAGKQYLAALFTDGSFALPANAISGVSSRPAKPGDTLLVYGVGFGPVSGGLTAGTVVTQANSLTIPVQFLFGTTAATASYYGLAPSFTGLYQFNLVVPQVSNNLALPFSFTLGGVKSTQTLYVAVQN